MPLPFHQRRTLPENAVRASRGCPRSVQRFEKRLTVLICELHTFGKEIFFSLECLAAGLSVMQGAHICHQVHGCQMMRYPFALPTRFHRTLQM